MIWIWRLFKFLLLLIIIYATARFGVVYFGSELQGERNPYIQLPTPTSVVLRWQTLENRMGVIRYGVDDGHLNMTALEDDVDKAHSVKIDGLDPDTRYYYEVGDIGGYSRGGTSKDWFRTLPEPGTERPARIWVIGDSGQPGQVADHVRDSMKRWIAANPRKGLPGIDVWLALGDLAYTSGTDKQFQAALFDTYPNLLRNTAIWPVYGNHDARRWTYFKLFTLPEHGEAGGVPSGTEHYYSFDFGDVHFIVLDSESSSTARGSSMVEWLRRDLEKNQSQWLIVAFHHPPYSKGSHDSDNYADSGGRMVDIRKHILPMLEAAGADLVLSGHSHMYERSYLIDCAYGNSDEFGPNRIVSDGVEDHNARYIKPLKNKSHSGTVYIVAGSSSKVDSGPINHPAMPVSMLEAGSLIIDIDGDTLTSRFLNDKGEVKDEFSITQQANYDSGYAGCTPDAEPVAPTATPVSDVAPKSQAAY
jgi:predicted phosphodiesterase